MKTQLVVTAMGADRPGLVNDLTRIVMAHGGSIDDSRMSILGGEFAVIVLISGAEEAIALLEQSLPDELEGMGLSSIVRRTRDREADGKSVPYVVEVVAVDQPGIVHKVSEFFSSCGINIADLTSDTYPAPHTGTRMFSLRMTVDVPPTVRAARLRQEFVEFCDEFYFDATLERLKA
jgi:glycine cleavage system transcriptional repressor